MKITDPDVIKDGEKDLIDAVKNDLDIEAVKQILKSRISATALSSSGGELLVHNNEIAFRLDFDLNLSGSLMFDRQGNYIPESDESEAGDEPENFVSEDLDLEDIDINETLEEVGPQTLLSDSDDTEIEEDDTVDEQLSIEDTMEEDFDINLPDLDLDDELAQDGDDTEELTDESEPSPEDDGFNDILKESQDFWDQKKES